MFCNKNKEKISSKGILPIFPSTYFTEVIFLKKQSPKTGHQNYKVVKTLI